MIKFGTSGFRAVIGDGFTKENVQKVAYAVCKNITKKKDAVIDIGFDNRFIANFYAKWVAEVFLYHKIKVNFYKHPTPTPALAFVSKSHTFGIVLTASHNPYYYNGVKVFKNGGEIDDDFAKKIEEIANSIEFEKIKTLPFDEGEKAGYLNIIDKTEDYEKDVISYLNKKNISKYKPKVLFNALHGNSSRIVREICKKIGFSHFEIMKENIDPYFENSLPAPYLKNLVDQKERVVKEKFDLGIAFDGDSDRITIIDKSGEMYDCNYVFPVVYEYLVKVKGLKGGVAHNGLFSSLIGMLAKEFGEEENLTKVGFKNIAKVFEKGKAFIGAETNGVALRDHVYCKDGIMTGFIVIDLMSYYQKSFKEILDELTKRFNFPSCTIEFAYPFSLEKKAEINKQVFINKELPKLKRKIVNVTYDDGCKIFFENNYWCGIRFSGNENVVRLFTEMENIKNANKMIAELEKFIGVKERQ